MTPWHKGSNFKGSDGGQARATGRRRRAMKTGPASIDPATLNPLHNIESPAAVSQKTKSLKGDKSSPFNIPGTI